ncbi:MAG TPA: acetylornithine deacetylase [Rhizomicrobium sp.]|jgi:acetylornithine deacetylase|nr:acetylornithine deacetylase [Rhizomicrobium sp.]
MSQAALDIVKALIAFDTTSRGSNLALIDFAQNLLEQSGARCRRSYDAAGRKANLFATIGPDGDGGFVLSGHTDVVPVDGQKWSSHPFKPEVRDGKLYGRGACDMKGFVGAALALAPEIAKAKLSKPIHFALSYDEEVGCIGVTGLLDDLKAQGIKPGLAIIGEPTLMKVVGAHKGGAKLVTRCCGREHHSSQPEHGANAVMMAGEFVHLLDNVWDELRADADPRFDPPHSTIQANMISGGTAVNILAREAEVTWEYRCLPDRDPNRIVERVKERAEAEVLPKYRARAPEAALETTLHAQYPGLAMDEDSPAIHLARELTGANHVEAVAYGTEAGHFQSYGIPAVICGPGSIEQAHRPDEFCALSELDACEAFLRKLIAKASA